MANGAWTLGEFPLPLVRITSGQYITGTQEYGRLYLKKGMSCGLHKRAFMNDRSGCTHLLAFSLSQISFAKKVNGNRHQKACEGALMSVLCSPATRPPLGAAELTTSNIWHWRYP